jgi:hypothetical protein
MQTCSTNPESDMSSLVTCCVQSRLDNIVSFLLPDPVGDFASLAR